MRFYQWNIYLNQRTGRFPACGPGVRTQFSPDCSFSTSARRSWPSAWNSLNGSDLARVRIISGCKPDWAYERTVDEMRIVGRVDASHTNIQNRTRMRIGAAIRFNTASDQPSRSFFTRWSWPPSRPSRTQQRNVSFSNSLFLKHAPSLNARRW